MSEMESQNDMVESIVVVHFGEIVLKGRNRTEFEKKLLENIRLQTGPVLGKMQRIDSRLLIHAKEDEQQQVLSALENVFGISWFSPSFVCERNLEEVVKLVVEKAGALKGRTLKVDASRSDKSFHLTSPEIERTIGKALEKEGQSIDMKTPQEKIFVSVLKEKIIISMGRTNGLGGLPVGSSGKVLCMLSGGIDSPVASWLMMKRGCAIDFLHVYSGTLDEVRNSKMIKLVEVLRRYSPKKFRLFLAPYTEFYKKSISIDPKIELVLFRRFIFRIANEVALKNSALGIASGDNIGQVASQTLENLAAVQSASKIPIHRPLLTYDKQEIVDLAKKIGTYEISIQEYKDCCSLVAAKHPSTKVKPDVAEKLEKEIGMDEVIKKTLGQIEVIEV